MSKFYLGQRVRVVRTDPEPGLSSTLGKEAFVVAKNSAGIYLSGAKFIGTKIQMAESGKIYCAPSGWIEPITKPGELTSIAEIQKMPSADWSIPAPGVVA